MEDGSARLLGKGEDGAISPPVGEGCLPQRRLILLLVMLGFFNVYAMRVNLSEAAEPMQRRYGWSEATKGLVLSSFFWGYVAGQVPGGLAAQRYGGKAVFGAGIATTALLTMLLPVVSSSLPALFVVRALMGLGEAVTYPAANVLYTQWVPSPERAVLVAFSSSGSYLGTAFAFPISSELIALRASNVTTYIDTKTGEVHGVSTSWPWVFYTFGALGLVWWGVWHLLAASSPEESSATSSGELAYIQRTRRQDADAVLSKVVVRRSASPPWRGFLTHRAAWALYINHAAYAWGAYTLLDFLPDYLDSQLGFDIKSSGGLSMLPYLLMFLSACGSGAVSDRMVRAMPVRRVRVIIQCAAFWLTSALLVATSYVETANSAVVCLTLAIGISGIAHGAYVVNYIDISPHYAGQIFSVGNTVASISGIIAPIVTGFVLGDKDTAGRERWRVVFAISAGFYVVASVVWIAFMSGKVRLIITPASACALVWHPRSLTPALRSTTPTPTTPARICALDAYWGFHSLLWN